MKGQESPEREPGMEAGASGKEKGMQDMKKAKREKGMRDMEKARGTGEARMPLEEKGVEFVRGLDPGMEALAGLESSRAFARSVDAAMLEGALRSGASVGSIAAVAGAREAAAPSPGRYWRSRLVLLCDLALKQTLGWLVDGEWYYDRQYSHGRVEELIDRGWLERRRFGPGLCQLRITDAGRRIIAESLENW